MLTGPLGSFVCSRVTRVTRLDVRPGTVPYRDKQLTKTIRLIGGLPSLLTEIAQIGESRWAWHDTTYSESAIYGLPYLQSMCTYLHVLSLRSLHQLCISLVSCHGPVAQITQEKGAKIENASGG